jgi:tetratricopeptide (TPR) repeat protein
LPVSRAKQSQGKDDTNEDEEMPGRAYLDMADAQVALGDWNAVLQLWDKALQLQTKRGTANHRAAIAETLARRGMHLASISMSLDAVRDLEKAVRLKALLCESKPSEKLSLDIANTLVHLSQAQDHLNLYVESRRSLDSALAIRKQALGEDHILVAEIHYQIAKGCHRRKRYSEAKISYGQALDVYRKLGIRHDDPTFSRIRRCAADRNISGSMFWEVAVSFTADI